LPEYGNEQIGYTGEIGNTGDKAYESVIVEARVYDGDGDKLGSYRDLIPELKGGEMWHFEIALHSRSDGIADHDIAATSN
jgi:hypothetical protein